MPGAAAVRILTQAACRRNHTREKARIRDKTMRRLASDRPLRKTTRHRDRNRHSKSGARVWFGAALACFGHRGSLQANGEGVGGRDRRTSKGSAPWSCSGTRFWRSVALLIAIGAATSGQAAELTLVVQTERADGPASFAPLGAYLSRAMGTNIRVDVRRNPLAHWRALAAGERPALVLEDPHFADYRISRAGYRLAAAITGTQSFQIAVGGFLLLDPMDLAGRPVATLSPPSLAAMQFLHFYSDPVRVPRLVEAGSYEEAAMLVLDGGAVAAVLPAMSLSDHPDLSGALALEELPEKALLVSPDLDEMTAERVGAALLAAATEAEGRRVLAAMGVSSFSRTHAEAYEGFARLLKGTWGYREAVP